MTYYKKTKDALVSSPRTQGARLGRLAVKRNVSVSEIARKTGASRPTVYNWFRGGNVSPAYRTAVTLLIAQLK